MRKLFYTTILLFITVAANAQFGTITFNQDTVVVMRRLKLLNVQVGAVSDSLISHKANGNIAKLHMNQLIIPYGNLSGAPFIPAAQVPSDWTASSGVQSILNKPIIPAAQVQSDWNAGVGMGVILNKPVIPSVSGTGISIVGNTVTNTQPDQLVTLTAGSGINITGTYPNFTISLVPPVINNAPGRLVNTNFTVSSTKTSTVFYTVTCSATNPLVIGSSSASAFLEYSINGGTNWLSATQASNLSSVGVAVAIQLTNSQTGVIGGTIPANALVRIRTAITGTAAVTLLSTGSIEMINSI